MNPIEKDPKDFSMRFLPHQTALVETFFNPASKRVILLRAEVGLGRNAALLALLSRLLQERPTARAMFLVSAAMRLQTAAMLQDVGVPNLVVDRYRFREMLDSTTEGELWPSGVALILSLDFAKQLDIRESLAKNRWELVIVEEAYSISGLRAEALRRIGSSSERVILATLPDLEAPNLFPAEDTTVIEWRRDRLVDHDGKPLDTVERPALHQVTFDLTPSELNLSQTVDGMCRILEAGSTQQGWIAKLLRRLLQSSPAALEGALQKLAEGLDASKIIDKLLDSLEDEVSEDEPFEFRNRLAGDEMAVVIRRALLEIEAIDNDSKLAALNKLLDYISHARTQSQRVCVATDFRATLYYLAAEIEARGMSCELLHGGMSFDERYRSLTAFSNTGKIFVATASLHMEGMNMQQVTDLILYDIPSGRRRLQQFLGRFDRLGRQSKLTVHVLVPRSSFGISAEKNLALLHDLFRSSTEVQLEH